MMLHPERATRILQQGYMDTQQLNLAQYIDQLVARNFKGPQQKGYAGGLQQTVQANLLEHLMQLGKASNVPSAVRATVYGSLENLHQHLNKNKTVAQAPYFKMMIENYLQTASAIDAIGVPKIPDGSPIGSMACDFDLLWK